MHSLGTGEQIRKLQGVEGGEVQGLVVDTINHLIITAGLGSVQCQKENGDMLRQCRGMFNSKDVDLLELSISHNIVIATHGATLCIIDYEFFRVLGHMNAPSQITSISVVTSSPVIILTTN